MTYNLGFFLNFAGHAVINPSDSHRFFTIPFLLFKVKIAHILIGIIMPVPSHYFLEVLSTRTASPRSSLFHRFQYFFIWRNHQQFLDAVQCFLWAIVTIAIDRCLAFWKRRPREIPCVMVLRLDLGFDEWGLIEHFFTRIGRIHDKLIKLFWEI